MRIAPARPSKTGPASLSIGQTSLVRVNFTESWNEIAQMVLKTVHCTLITKTALNGYCGETRSFLKSLRLSDYCVNERIAW